MTDDEGQPAACARCCTLRPPHELTTRGGDQVCADTSQCEATLPPLIPAS